MQGPETNSGQPKIGVPHIIQAPLTPHGREIAFNEVVGGIVTDYLVHSESRKWNPHKDLPLDQMKELGPRISDRTITQALVFYGIEAYLPDYAASARADSRGKEPFERLYNLGWIPQEGRHVATTRMILESAGVSEAEINAFDKLRRQNPWRTTQHPGMPGSLIGAVEYADDQELNTGIHYWQLLWDVMKDYRMPVKQSQELPPTVIRETPQIDQKELVGAAVGLNFTRLDEYDHHDVFHRIVKEGFLRYYEAESLDTLDEVNDGYGMPGFRLLPNRREAIRAFSGVEVYSTRTQRDRVLRPIITDLGLETRFPKYFPELVAPNPSVSPENKN